MQVRRKYPRTYHMPKSPGASSDDKILPDMSHMHGKLVRITEKRDGECTSLYGDGYVHARSIDGTGKEYQDWIKSRWSKVAHDLPHNWQVCGENLYARHSIAYENLPSYFEAFGVIDDTNHFISYVDFTVIVACLELQPVPLVAPLMVFDEEKIYQIAQEVVERGGEGIVIWNTEAFHIDEFHLNVAKYVRANHVQTDVHWTKNWTKNGLMVTK